MADRRIRLHVQNPPTPETAPPGYPVRKMDPAFVITEAQFADAAARHPDVAARLDTSFGATTDEFLAAMQEAEVVIATTQQLKEQFPAPAPALRWAMVTSQSFHKLLPLDWLPDGAFLVHNSGPHADKAGEFVAAALLMLNCRIPYFVSAKERREWAPLVTTGITGKSLLVIGLGHLGTAATVRGRELGLSVKGISRSGRPHPMCSEVRGPGSLYDMLPDADFVYLATPYLDELVGWFDAAAFAAMKPGSGFITTAPTRTLDADALIANLKSGHLSGAVLDGFDPEPVPPEAELWDTPNLIMTPHTSCIDAETYSPKTLDVLFANLRADLADAPLPTRADLTRGY